MGLKLFPQSPFFNRSKEQPHGNHWIPGWQHFMLVFIVCAGSVATVTIIISIIVWIILLFIWDLIWSLQTLRARRFPPWYRWEYWDDARLQCWKVTGLLLSKGRIKDSSPYLELMPRSKARACPCNGSSDYYCCSSVSKTCAVGECTHSGLAAFSSLSFQWLPQ